MKNLNLYLIMIVAGCLVPSCDGKLDIEPRQELATELVFVNEANLRSALVGAYSAIKGSFGDNEGGELYGGDFNMISELLASDGDNVFFAGSFSTYREVSRRAIFPDNTMIRDNWIRAYDAINTVNNVLANLDLADSQASSDDIEGQAKCIRGMIYFELVRFWSKPWGSGTESTDPGVPLVLDPILTVSDAEALGNIGRSNVAAVYTQVISDLQDAKSLLSEDRNGTDLSSNAASAILSRVYLQQGNYTQAAIEANTVIQRDLYELTATPLAAFNNTANSSEDIFAIQQSTLSNAGTNNGGLTTFYASLNGPGRGDMQVDTLWIASYEAGDLRGGLQTDLSDDATITNVTEMYYEGIGARSGNYMCAKWGNGELNIPVIRYAEMLLTRAEANFEDGTTVGDTPLNDINLIRERAGLDPLITVTLDDIREERMKEFAFEGFALHDMKRWQVPVAGSFTFDANELILPIPERETEVYDISQNDGYN